MLRKLLKYGNYRNFSNTRVWRNLDKIKSPELEKNINPGANLRTDHVPTVFEKQLMQWFGKYKSKEDIPTRVSLSEIEFVKSRFRIIFGTFLMGCTLALCFYYVQLGKKKARQGETMTSVQKERELKILERLK